jgi:hypothetical protein
MFFVQQHGIFSQTVHTFLHEHTKFIVRKATGHHYITWYWTGASCCACVLKKIINQLPLFATYRVFTVHKLHYMFRLYSHHQVHHIF